MPIELVHNLAAFGVLCLLCSGPSQLVNPILPSARWNLEAGVIYSTFQRAPLDSGGYSPKPGSEFDGGDTTFHGVALDAGRRWPSALGVGTPAKEFAFGILEAPTHNEAQTKAYETHPRIVTTGNGRFESLWFRVRYPVSSRGSVEFSVERPYYTEADIIVLGDDLYFGSSKRNLLSDVRNTAGGYRHFGKGYELAGQVVWTDIRTQFGTGRSFMNGSGTVWGVQAEYLRQMGTWRGQFIAGYQEGTVDSEGGFFPDFEPWSGQFSHSRTFVGLGAGYQWRRWGAGLTARGVWLRSPYWDSGAFTNTETYQIDQGRSFEISARELLLDLSVSYEVSESLRLSGFAFRRLGDDATTLAPTLPGVAPGGFESNPRGWACGVGFQVRVP